MSLTHGSDDDAIAWHRRASGTFKAPPGRPGRPRADLPGRSLPVERPAPQRLKRRGVKSPEVPLILKPADPTAGLWKRKAPNSGRMPKGRRPRVVLTTRELVAGPPVRKWIGPAKAEDAPAGGFILTVERWIFGDPDVAETSWKRPPAAPERREWPLPEARPVGLVKGRPLPRRKVTVPPPRHRRV